jgi:hypothetical protein
VLTMWPGFMIHAYGDALKKLVFRNCQTLQLRWRSILKEICFSPTVDHVSIVDCKVIDCEPAGPGVPGDSSTSLVPFDELGATRWVGNAEIREGLM